jgi:hypothetical protein
MAPSDFIAVVKDVNRHVFSRERGFTVKDIHVGYGGTTVPFVLHGIEDEEEEQSPIEIEFDGKTLTACVEHDENTISNDHNRGGGGGGTNALQEYVTHTYTLTLTCSDYGTIQEYVKRCVKVHELEELQVTHEDPKMFILDGVRMDDEDSNDHSPALDYIVIDYPYDETFDNKYFTCKAKLRDICAAFERNRQKHKELGINFLRKYGRNGGGKNCRHNPVS